MRRFLSPFLALAIVACTEGGPGPIEIDRTGTLLGIAYVDRDADGEQSPADVPAPGVAAALILASGDTVARATAGTDGRFVMANVPVGNYSLVARLGSLGDTLQVQKIDTVAVAIAANDTVRRQIRLGYPVITSEAARALPVGRRVVIEGLALNPWPAFGDSSLHVVDSRGVIRSVRVVPSAFQPGDSVRIIGTTGLNQTRPVLVDVGVQVLAGGRVIPPPDSVPTNLVSGAVNGTRLDGMLRIAGAVIQDTLTVGNYRRLGVNDGSGRAEVMLPRNQPYPPETFQLGAVLEVTGLLAPAIGGATWVLRPRAPADVNATFPTVTAAEVGGLPLGKRVYLVGKALNSWGTFGDSTMHVLDNTGVIRAARVASTSVSAGDSIRLLGTIGLREARVTLLDASVLLLAAARGLPDVDSVSTAIAASAGAGARAYAPVRIGNAIIQDTATVVGDRILGVDDGSGRLEVVLDKDVTFNTGPWVPGGTFRGAGLLVPAPGGNGTWRLKPRNRDEAEISFPTITIGEARTSDQGRRVIVEAVALNGWSTFGDSTIHVFDATGAIRGVRVIGSNIQAGDSVRLLGTVGRINQQPVLTGTTATLMFRGLQLPVPDSVSTAVAATAAGGTRDANQVRVSGTIIGTQQLPSGDAIYTIDDGSGRLDVVYDKDISFGTAPQPGAILTATGLLLAGTDGKWQLKPRSSADVSSTFPTVTIAEARNLPPGRTVYIRGLALNGWVTYTDRAVHMYDRRDAIRVLSLPQAQVFAGDSIRVLGTISTRDGQPVIVGTQSNVLLTGVGLPKPDSISVIRAITADGGVLDAHQVAISGRILKIDTIASSERRLHLSEVGDTTRMLAVFLDRSVGFPVANFKANDYVRVRGVLVAREGGADWELRPRSLAEIAVVQPPQQPAAAPAPDGPTGATDYPGTSPARREEPPEGRGPAGEAAVSALRRSPALNHRLRPGSRARSYERPPRAA